jgi:predicted RNA-binding protein with PUA-like domain
MAAAAVLLCFKRGFASGTSLAGSGNGRLPRSKEERSGIIAPSTFLDTIQLVENARPMPYLLKTEPSAYSFENLQRDKETLWDGVTNPVALKNMRGMKAGDKLIVYHTGDERRAVGTAIVSSVDVSDAKNPAVRIRVGKPIAQPKTLAEIKASSLFAGSPLVTQGRLSVVSLNERQFAWLSGD